MTSFCSRVWPAVDEPGLVGARPSRSLETMTRAPQLGDRLYGSSFWASRRGRSWADRVRNGGTEYLQGALRDKAPPQWRLTIEANRSIMVMRLLVSPTLHITNLSAAPLLGSVVLSPDQVSRDALRQGRRGAGDWPSIPAVQVHRWAAWITTSVAATELHGDRREVGDTREIRPTRSVGVRPHRAREIGTQGNTVPTAPGMSRRRRGLRESSPRRLVCPFSVRTPRPRI